MAGSYINQFVPPVARELSSSYDLNDFTTTMFIKWGTIPTHAPSMLNGWCIVIEAPNGNVLQLAFCNPHSSTQITPKRRALSNGEWSDWKDL